MPRDGILVVHSAIAGLSRKGFRAEAMIEALLGPHVRRHGGHADDDMAHRYAGKAGMGRAGDALSYRCADRDISDALCPRPKHPSDPFGRRLRTAARTFLVAPSSR